MSVVKRNSVISQHPMADLVPAPVEQDQPAITGCPPAKLITDGKMLRVLSEATEASE